MQIINEVKFISLNLEKSALILSIHTQFVINPYSSRAQGNLKYPQILSISLKSSQSLFVLTLGFPPPRFWSLWWKPLWINKSQIKTKDLGIRLAFRGYLNHNRPVKARVNQPPLYVAVGNWGAKQFNPRDDMNTNGFISSTLSYCSPKASTTAGSRNQSASWLHNRLSSFSEQGYP